MPDKSNNKYWHNKGKITKSADIREAFLAYFADHGHKIIASSSLIPANDPSLLFTNAGMVQFKDVFLGLESTYYNSAASSQCCIRAGGKHNDLENVGFTARHHTFFEMLGNFSFSAYFKREAIIYAWEFLTQILGLPAEKLWITVYEEDKETENIWLNEMGVSPQRFSRCGARDNFWSMGETGPCGPCSEIFYDHGPAVAGGPPGSDEADGDRYVEIWNLVFMQFNRQADGTLSALPNPAVDTGMGLERISAVMQGVSSNYDIDIFKYLIAAIIKLKPDVEQNHPGIRVIADHLRAVSFLITDGIVPSNEGRGYVLRRIIRRALRYGHKLDLPSPFLYSLVPALGYVMGDAYPLLVKNQHKIADILRTEEEQFNHTLDYGLQLLKEEVNKLSKLSCEKIIAGELAFRLYDTYGFPLDLTADIAQEYGFTVDEKGFADFMQRQRALSQASQNFKMDYNFLSSVQENSEFVGYEKISANAIIINLINNGEKVEQLTQGMEGGVILNQTPFYAESGGQIGDEGSLIAIDKSLFQVIDTQRAGKAIIHYGKVIHGNLGIGQEITAAINVNRRDDIKLNHTATHLLHASLKKLLGDNIQQKGSLVNDSYARFDFSFNASLTVQQLEQIERLINEQILANFPVMTKLMDLATAKESGALALFGEKYQDKVRVLSIAEFSKELCGGTHVSRTGDIGLCKLIAEYGVASGIRRIEFKTGRWALQWINEQLDILQTLSKNLKTTSEQATEKLSQILHINKEQERKILQLNAKLTNSTVAELVAQVEKINEASLLIVTIHDKNMSELRALLDALRSKLKNEIIILVAINNNTIQSLVVVNKNLLSKVSSAVVLLKKICNKGGGRNDMAQGGGDLPPDLSVKLAQIKDLVKLELTKN